MKIVWIMAGIVVCVTAVVLLLAYICYRMAFYAANRPVEQGDAIEIPQGEIYEPYREKMEKWVLECRATPHEEICITSFDGLQLRGNYYEYAPGAPIELMFHGYRGSAERDLSGGMQRCFRLGRSALIVHQRSSPGSEGHVITFGIREYRDCLLWLEWMLQRFGPEAKIILTGISMGAATVLMAGGEKLPPNVIGILADCGYSSAKDIMKDVIGKMGLPADLVYPFVKLGAKLYGRFDPDENSPEQAMKRCTVPVNFFHGEADDFVPCDISRVNYNSCAAKKMLVTVSGAGHGLSYAVAPERYLQALREFFGPEASADACAECVPQVQSIAANGQTMGE